MSFWPGVDKWPPPRWVWIYAAVVTAIAAPILIFGGVIGAAIYAIFLIVCLVRGANQRLRNMNAEEFWDSKPKD